MQTGGTEYLNHEPGYTGGLHMICKCNVIAPDIELPLAKPQDSAENGSGVHTNPHVHIYTRCHSNLSAMRHCQLM